MSDDPLKGMNDEQLSEAIEASPEIGRAMRILTEAKIAPQDWAEEEGIDFDALRAFTLLLARREQANDHISSFGAAGYAFEVAWIASKLARRRWTDYHEALAGLVSELRGGHIDQATFFELVDAATPKIGDK